jgi:hypothetical protein
MHSFRLDALVSGEWATIFIANSHNNGSGFTLTNLEGWTTSPSLIRNTATPLFGDGIIASPLAQYGARFFGASILYRGDTIADGNAFARTLYTLSTNSKNSKFRCFVSYSAPSAPTGYTMVWHEYTDAFADETFISAFKQMRNFAEFTLDFMAPNPTITRVTGEIPTD